MRYLLFLFLFITANLDAQVILNCRKCYDKVSCNGCELVQGNFTGIEITQNSVSTYLWSPVSVTTKGKQVEFRDPFGNMFRTDFTRIRSYNTVAKLRDFLTECVCSDNKHTVLTDNEDGTYTFVNELGDTTVINAGGIEVDEVDSTGFSVTYPNGVVDTILFGASGTPGADGVGIQSAQFNSGELLLELTDGTFLGPFNIQGPKGDKGVKGDTGPMGMTGPQGEPGIPGTIFAFMGEYSETTEYWDNMVVEYNGSSYISIMGGNIGNQPDLNPDKWSLMAAAGEDGLSAYQVALANGFIGTEEAWLESLVGDDGAVGPPGPAGTTDHSLLTNLTNDDHAQYLNLNGRSSGQTVKGGTASGENLTLMSTDNATKGSIIFGNSAYDEVNNRLGIGTISPLYAFHIVNPLNGLDNLSLTTSSGRLKLTNNIGGGTTFFDFDSGAGSSQIKTGSNSLIVTSPQLSLTPPSLTGSQSTSALNITQTWNTTGNPTAISLDITNTASGATSNLMDLKVGGVSRFIVNKSGETTTNALYVINEGKILSSNSNYSGIQLCALGTSGGSNVRITQTLGTVSANPSALFQIESTTKGFLPPRMTATQASAISSPAEGLMVYVTDTNVTFTSKGWWGYNGATWEKLNN